MTDCPFNLSDVLAELETHPGRWKKGPRMEMIRALKRLPKKFNMALEDLPADEVELAAILDAKMHWRRDGFNCERSFQNFRGRVLRAAREVRPGGMPCFTRHHHYGPAWRPLVDDIDAAIARGDENGRVWKGLSHLTGYANWRGLSPEEVDSGVLADLIAVHAETKRVVRSRGGRPRTFARTAIEAAQAWNKLVREKNQKPWLRHLPAAILEWEGKHSRLNEQFAAFPKSFQDEVDGYFHFMKMAPEPRPEQEAADPRLGEFGHIRDSVPETEQPPLPDIVFKKRKRRPAKLNTVKTREWAILQTANALVRYGEMKLEEIRSLRDITSLRALKISLSDFRSRHEAAGRFDKTAASRFHLASYLIQIARFAGWHAAHIGEMEKLRDMPDICTASVNAMSANRRDLLDQFDEPWAVQAWFDRPGQLFDRAEALRRKTGEITPSMIADVETAIICETVRILPGRRANLGLLQYKGDERSLILARHAGEKSWLLWRPDKVKNERRLRAQLSREAERMIRVYLEHYRPRYLELQPGTPDSTFLFPGRVHDGDGAGHRSLGNIGGNFSKRMEAAGLTMTLHLCRHLIAQLVLDADPSQKQLVADLLGDKVETVEAFYITGRSETASKKLRELFGERVHMMTREWREFDMLKAA